MRVRATLTLRNAKMVNAREERKLTQWACCHAVGCSIGILADLERMDYRKFSGEGAYPTRRRRAAADIAATLGLTVADVLPEALVGEHVQASAVREVDVDEGNLLCMGRSNAVLALPASASAERNEAAQLLRQAVLDLPNARGATSLVLRYGLDGKGERTLTEVGKTMGVTRERARQLILKAERDLSVPERIGRAAEAAGL